MKVVASALRPHDGHKLHEEHVANGSRDEGRKEAGVGSEVT